MDNIYQDLASSIEKVVRFQPEKKRAKLGYVYLGEYTIVDPDDQRFYFARFPDGGFIRGRHYGKISPIPDSDVMVVKEKGGHRIEAILGEFESGLSTGGDSGIGYHTHERYTPFAYAIDTWLLENIRVTLSSGVIVTIGEGFYFDNGTLKYLEEDTLDLTAHIPATVLQKRWVILALNTSDGSINVYLSATSSMLISVNLATIADIDFEDDIPLVAIVLENGMTVIDEDEMVDLRSALSKDFLVSGDSVIVTISGGVATINSSISFFKIAAQTGTADDLDTITITGKPRILLLQADTGDTITVKHSVGNIELNAESDYVLSGDKTLALFWDGVNLSDVGIGSSDASGSVGGQQIFTYENALTVSTNPLRLYNISGATRTITKVFCSVATAPTGSKIIVDILMNGTTIFTTSSNRPEIAISAFTGQSTTIEVPDWDDGDYLQMRVAQIGSTIAGAYLTVQVVYS